MANLTAIEVKHAKRTENPRKLAGGGGLFLLVKPASGFTPS